MNRIAVKRVCASISIPRSCLRAAGDELLLQCHCVPPTTYCHILHRMLSDSHSRLQVHHVAR